MSYGRSLVLGLVVVVLAVLSVFAGLRYFGGQDDSGPIMIAADDTSVKEAPEDPGGEVVPNQDNVIFNDAAETLASAPRQDSLIASDQEPVDVEDIAPNPLAETATGGTTEVGGGIVEPRKVRTIIVRPDGTLVERTAPEEPAATVNESVAGAASAGAAVSPQEPAVPDVPVPGNGGFQSAEAGLAANTPQAQSVTDVLNGAVAQPETAEAADTEAPATMPGPVEDFGIANVPIPTPRASSAGARVASAPVQAAPAAAVQPAPVAASSALSASASPYAMQIASLPTEAEARQAYQRLAAQYPAELGRRPVEIVSAELAGRGTYYRVRIPAGTLSEALSLCERFQAAGGSCFVPR
nr:SPOR domain-containing protein [Marinicella sp. W31]MDC2877519.1 SPOR domain-containing protein [Marinicella sp. W31]